MSLFTELECRNVIRVGGLYLVGAWLLIQIAETPSIRAMPEGDVPIETFADYEPTPSHRFTRVSRGAER